MRVPSSSAVPARLPAALAASNVGSWYCDLTTGLVQYDDIAADVFGVSPERGAVGEPLQRFIDAIHPDDRALFDRKNDHVLTNGGMIVVEYRTVPRPGHVRWVLARGRYDKDATGRVTHGRGIVIDITDSKQDGHVEDRAFFLEGEGFRSSLDRAAHHAIEAHRAISQLEPPQTTRLSPLIDALLFGIGRAIAATFASEKDAMRDVPSPPIDRRRRSSH